MYCIHQTKITYVTMVTKPYVLHLWPHLPFKELSELYEATRLCKQLCKCTCKIVGGWVNCVLHLSLGLSRPCMLAMSDNVV